MLITIVESPLDAILKLRHELLRPDRKPEELVSQADISDMAIHLIATINGQTAGMLSAGPEPCPFNPCDNSWRLRGLAVIESARRRGVATALLKSVIARSHAKGARALWGLTRMAAVATHIRLGFETIGEPYEIPPTGPHCSTFVRLTDALVSLLSHPQRPRNVVGRHCV
ncbi:GNAT family N-acetyltransferase [Bradyrhizobium sp. B120]|uniref:GNAT family N-acetyltransferase n=1 Tax=Bradyrhizobium sp. B120 TaxID=3410088 RepID=UPI003B986D6E